MQDNLVTIDTTYDFRVDANGKDPDTHSAMLRSYHKMLWNKPLPNGTLFVLDDVTPGVYLHHKSPLGEFLLTSDSVIPTFSRWKRYAHIIEQLPRDEVEYFRYIGYTIGGMMLFPGNQVDGKMTINGERGFNRKIVDRLDLTLECIRRHYQSEDSPMTATLLRYSDYFNLFGDFRGYIDFFLLQDLVTNDYSGITFFTAFDNFISSPLPQSLDEYRTYKETTIAFIKARNHRVKKLTSTDNSCHFYSNT